MIHQVTSEDKIKLRVRWQQPMTQMKEISRPESICHLQKSKKYDAYSPIFLPHPSQHEASPFQGDPITVTFVELLKSYMCRGHATPLFAVSSAFYSVDHTILPQRLTTSFGLVDQPIAWLKSFLSGRSSCVILSQSRSSWVSTPFGIP